MSGYYPDGVSGNEPQIAGYDEREVTVEVECTNVDFCEFTGEVEVLVQFTYRDRYVIYGNRYWTCPECGTDNEEFDVEVDETDD